MKSLRDTTTHVVKGVETSLNTHVNFFEDLVNFVAVWGILVL